MKSLILICTRNRPEHLLRTLEHIMAARPSAHVLVWDASHGVSSATVCSEVASTQPASTVEYVKAPRAGLPLQRNDAIRHCTGMQLDIVHFLDDDIDVEVGYFDALESALEADPCLAGVGGVFTNPIRVRMRRLKRVFLLDGGRPGVVFSSGAQSTAVRWCPSVRPDGMAFRRKHELADMGLSFPCL